MGKGNIITVSQRHYAGVTMHAAADKERDTNCDRQMYLNKTLPDDASHTKGKAVEIQKQQKPLKNQAFTANRAKRNNQSITQNM
jgi:hypothetical protein